MTSNNGNEIAVMHSIRRPHTDRIKAGVKTVEIRTTKPSVPPPFADYIYEPKSGGGCGKVIGEFVCDRIDEAPTSFISPETVNFAIRGCVSVNDIVKYGKGRTVYGLHISQLKIYDKPKELSEFYKRCDIPENKCKLCDNCYLREDHYGREYTVKKITRPPQSWCYVEKIY